MKISRANRRILLESLLIVFSILFALALDAWWQERREAGRVAAARAAFVEEIRGNQALLAGDRYLPYHRAMWESFREASRIEAPTEQDVENAWTGFSNGVWPTPFRDAVWRSLSNTDVMGRMDFDELFMIADIYREQANVDGWHTRMFDMWAESRSDRSTPEFVKDDIQRTRSYLADVVAGEERLLAQYDSALAVLDGGRTR